MLRVSSSWTANTSSSTPIVTFRPDVAAAGRVDELAGKPNAVAGLANAAFQHVTHAQFAAYLRMSSDLPL